MARNEGLCTHVVVHGPISELGRDDFQKPPPYPPVISYAFTVHASDRGLGTPTWAVGTTDE